ncbi:MAG: protein kinase [Desulfobacterales bacterium]|nr:protein kinase [Desulfobacterales bacterium]
MIDFPEYSVILKIYESSNSLVYSALKKSNNLPVIIKILKNDYPTIEEMDRYKQEYKITSNHNMQRIIKSYDMIQYQSTEAIIFEDFGGESLNLLMKTKKFTLRELLDILIKISEAIMTYLTTSMILSQTHCIAENLILNPLPNMFIKRLVETPFCKRLRNILPYIRTRNSLMGFVLNAQKNYIQKLHRFNKIKEA